MTCNGTKVWLNAQNQGNTIFLCVCCEHRAGDGAAARVSCSLGNKIGFASHVFTISNDRCHCETVVAELAGHSLARRNRKDKCTQNMN